MISEEPSPSRPAPRRPRRWPRRVALTLAALLGLALLVALLLLKCPVPVPGLLAGLERELSQTLGLPVSVESAHLFVFDRLLTLRGLRIGPAGDGHSAAPEAGLVIKEVGLLLRWDDWRVWQTAPEIVRVEVQGVRGADLALDAEGLALLAGGKRVVKWDSGAAGGLALDAVQVPVVSIADAAVRVVEMRPDRPQALFACEDLSLELLPGERGALRLARWQGRWRPAVGGARRFRGSLERTGAQELALLLHLDGFDTAEMLALPGSLHLTGQSLDLQARLDLSPEHPALDATLTGENLSWVVTTGSSTAGPGLRLTQGSERPSVRVRLRGDPAQSRWLLEPSDLSLGGARIRAEGQVHRAPGWPVDLHLTSEDVPLARTLLDLFVRRYGVAVEGGTVALDMHAHGLATEPRTLASAGRLEIRGGEVCAGHPLQAHGTGITGAILFEHAPEREAYRAEFVRGDLGDFQFLIPSAEVVRHGAADDVRYEASLQLQASGEVAPLAERLAQIAHVSLGEPPSGSVRLRGHLEHTVRPRRRPAEPPPEPPRFRGEIVMSDVVVPLAQWGQLEAPAATVRFATDWLEMPPTPATFDGQPLTLWARVEGAPFFWKTARFEAEAQVAADAGDLLARWPDLQARLPLPEPPTGDLDLALSVRGHLLDPSAWRRAAIVRPQGLRIPFEAGQRRGLIELTGGELELARDAVRVTNLRARVGEVPVTLDGLVTPSRAQVQAHTQTTGEAIEDATFGSITGLILAGPVGVDLDAALDLAPFPAGADPQGQGFTNPALLAALGDQIRGGVTGFLTSAEQSPLEVNAVFHLQGTTVTPVFCPVDITDASGEVTWDGAVFRAADVRVRAGATGPATVTRMLYDPRLPNERLQLEVDVPRLDLTEWIRPWVRRGWENLSREERRALAYGRGHPQKVSIVDVTVRAGEVGWRGLRGGAGSARIRNEFRRADRLSRLDIEGIQVAGYGGTGAGEYHVVNRDEGAEQTVHLEVDRVDVNSLLNDLLTVRHTDAEGRLTGALDLHVAPGQRWRDMTGEGHAELTESSIMRSTIFREIGRLTGLRQFNDISFSTIAADVAIADRRVRFENLVMNTSWTTISGEGSVGFDHSMDFALRLELVRTVTSAVPGTGWIPGIGWVSRMMDAAINTVLLTIRVEGTVQEPRVALVQPLLQPLLDTVFGSAPGANR